MRRRKRKVKGERNEQYLSTIYPALASELSENISYYTAKNIQTDFLIILISHQLKTPLASI